MNVQKNSIIWVLEELVTSMEQGTLTVGKVEHATVSFNRFCTIEGLTLRDRNNYQNGTLDQLIKDLSVLHTISDLKFKIMLRRLRAGDNCQDFNLTPVINKLKRFGAAYVVTPERRCW